jgi:hypothetical protein
MNRCRKHDRPIKSSCPECHGTKSADTPLSSKELLAQRLAIFLVSNDVENYVSPSGYRFKKITLRQRTEPAA